MLRYLIVVVSFCLFCISLKAGNNVTILNNEAKHAFSDSIDGPHPKRNLIGLPLIFRSPETDWGFGIGAFYAGRFRKYSKDTRPTQVQLAVSYTLLDQILVHIPFHYFSNRNRYQVSGEFSYYRFIYEYFGIGNNTQPEALEFFTALYPRIRLQGLAKVGPSQYLGLRYWMDDFTLTEIEEGGLLYNQTVAGSNGGVVSALGLVYQFDNRNTIFSTQKGLYLELVSLFNNPFLGSDFNFFKQNIDFRYFIPIDKTSLAFQVYSEVIAGEAPFNQKAMLGGMRRLRGYYEGRYRDNVGVIFQSEWRFHLFWRVHGVLNLAAGLVGPNIWSMDPKFIRPSAGTGLRFAINEKDRIFVRLDYNVGHRSSNYYLTVGEAF